MERSCPGSIRILWPLSGLSRLPRTLIPILLLAVILFTAATYASPLSILSSHPHYFRGQDGKPVYLVGDYCWGTLARPGFRYQVQFDTLRSHHLNLARVWLVWGPDRWEWPKGVFQQWLCPFLRTGPGKANDGRPRYDLTRYNPDFFRRLQNLCQAAAERGIYLQLTLFDCWNIKHPRLWAVHPFNRANNINGADGDPAHTGKGTDGRHGWLSPSNRTCWELECALVRRIVKTLNRFDNIYYEIANENYYNREWELKLARYIQQIEKDLPKQHLVMPLDIPNHDEGGIKTWDLPRIRRNMLKMLSRNCPILLDTDGLGNPADPVVRRAAWTAFVSGGHFSYLDDSMEPGPEYHNEESGSKRASLRAQLGHLARFVRSLPFYELKPLPHMVISGKVYAAGDPDRWWILYFPSGGKAQVRLPTGTLRLRWYNPRTGQYLSTQTLTGGKATLTAPTSQDWVACMEKETP